jgi:hypothetical protein
MCKLFMTGTATQQHAGCGTFFCVPRFRPRAHGHRASCDWPITSRASRSSFFAMRLLQTDCLEPLHPPCNTSWTPRPWPLGMNQHCSQLEIKIQYSHSNASGCIWTLSTICDKDSRSVSWQTGGRTDGRTGRQPDTGTGTEGWKDRFSSQRKAGNPSPPPLHKHKYWLWRMPAVSLCS